MNEELRKHLESLLGELTFKHKTVKYADDKSFNYETLSRKNKESKVLISICIPDNKDVEEIVVRLKDKYEKQG